MAVSIVECPRDAMQGIRQFIPTHIKTEYLKLLLKCGFHTLDCGSFVNPEYVPQMADTAEVLAAIEPYKGQNKLLTIVANERGAARAAGFHQIEYLGFPFSINETFQRRNTNSGILDAFIRLQKINEIAVSSGKDVVAYISMAFGNPYGEEYKRELAIEWAEKIAKAGIKIISLSDTIGEAKTEDIQYLFSHIKNNLPDVELGAHFHAKPGEWLPKIEAAYEAGCRRFDGAILGFGGCPMAKDDLTGNIPTEQMVSWLNEKDNCGIDMNHLHEAQVSALSVYNAH